MRGIVVVDQPVDNMVAVAGKRRRRVGVDHGRRLGAAERGRAGRRSGHRAAARHHRGRHGVVIWSLWAGYLSEPSGQRLQAQLDAHGVPVVHHHTSGHAPLCDLKRLVAALGPGRVVPIHTEGAHEYSRHFPRVTTYGDGTWWDV